MKKNFLLNSFLGFSIIIIFFSCTAKNSVAETEKETNYIPYYLEVYKADSLQIIGKNKEAFEKLDSLFKIYKPLNQIFYMRCLAMFDSEYLKKGEKM